MTKKDSLPIRPWTIALILGVLTPAALGAGAFVMLANTGPEYTETCVVTGSSVAYKAGESVSTSCGTFSLRSGVEVKSGVEYELTLQPQMLSTRIVAADEV